MFQAFRTRDFYTVRLGRWSGLGSGACLTLHRREHVDIADVDEIRHRLDGVEHDVVLCAHKYVPRAVWLPGAQAIGNE